MYIAINKYWDSLSSTNLIFVRHENFNKRLKSHIVVQYSCDRYFAVKFNLHVHLCLSHIHSSTFHVRNFPSVSKTRSNPSKNRSNTSHYYDRNNVHKSRRQNWLSRAQLCMTRGHTRDLYVHADTQMDLFCAPWMYVHEVKKGH